MTIYRRIYKQHYGPIPVDETGRTYDVHHIDGNRKNNDPSNLVALSIQEHYNVHYEQGDYGACLRIIARKNVPAELLSELASKSNFDRVKRGDHPFLGGNIQRQNALKMVKEGTNPFCGSDLQRKRIEEHTHNFLGENNPVYKMIKDGTHHFFDGKIARESQLKRSENGTHNFQNQPKVECPYCGKVGALGTMKRWHFENCKEKSE